MGHIIFLVFGLFFVNSLTKKRNYFKVHKAKDNLKDRLLLYPLFFSLKSHNNTPNLFISYY